MSFLNPQRSQAARSVLKKVVLAAMHVTTQPRRTGLEATMKIQNKKPIRVGVTVVKTKNKPIRAVVTVLKSENKPTRAIVTVVNPRQLRTAAPMRSTLRSQALLGKKAGTR